MPIQLLSEQDALRAIYLDFEGTIADPPSLLGVLYLEDDEQDPEFVQYVHERAFESAFPSRPWCRNLSIESALGEIGQLAREENRILVAGSGRENRAIDQYVDSSDVGDLVAGNLVDARILARKWKRRFYPEVVFPYVTGQGRHRLAEYMKLVGYHVPASHGPGNTGQRIRYVRRQLVSRCGDFSSITATGKAKWTNLLKHNFHDCAGLRAVLTRVIEGLSRS